MVKHLIHRFKVRGNDDAILSLYVSIQTRDGVVIVQHWTNSGRGKWTKIRAVRDEMLGPSSASLAPHRADSTLFEIINLAAFLGFRKAYLIRFLVRHYLIVTGQVKRGSSGTVRRSN